MNVDSSKTSSRFVGGLRRSGLSRTGIVLVSGLCVLMIPQPAEAYIGPGAGFAVGTTVVAFFVAFLSSIAAMFLWPIRWLVRAIRGLRAHRRARVKRVVILGLDGMEPTLVERYMAEGKLPHFSKLKETGAYSVLGTTAPPLSPVAWSSFLTSCNPGKHRIFDFLTRDVRTYLPKLSSVSIKGSSRALRLGKYQWPLGKPDIRLHRKGRPFWNILGEHGVFSSIIRVPITFPPEPFNGVLLSAMCVPDLRGSQGTFSFYTTRAKNEDEYTGGEWIYLERNGRTIESHLVGPENSFLRDGGSMRCPFKLAVTGENEASISICGQTIALKVGRFTPWVAVKFKTGLGIKVHGLCEFLLVNTEPEIELYVTPIQIDPAKPAMAISHPPVFATYLAKAHGPYATLGLAEDTWALNAGIINDDAFLHQCLEADTEREAMFFDSLEKVRRGLCVCVFDGTDRIQHMFWRYIDPGHPADNGETQDQHRGAIEEHYCRMDDLLRRTMEECAGTDTVLMVVSDHGFTSFRRGVDLNVWLEQNGYLKLKPDGRGKKYLAGVDWTETRAFALGLAGIWLNIKGREAQGIVDPKDAAALRTEICEKLSGLCDKQRGETAISRALNTHEVYRGPYRQDGPDIMIGYNKGYRVCWEAAVGEPTDALFHDNTKAWSGDHCIDPKLIPGVLFCNRRIRSSRPRLLDLGATVLDLFGVRVPKQMDGRPLCIADEDGSFPEEVGSEDVGQSTKKPTKGGSGDGED